ncbi:MAG: hydroxymethylglutaryl-CoA reductase, degradative [candidate division Zixibacteria bacterium]|nr:hydroxymethylglutaryl-CoA reductase, degradative [candidate division Zixibacteria bacterium]
MKTKKNNIVENGKRLTIKSVITSRIPGFYRLPVEQRLAYISRCFNLTDKEVAELRNGDALRVEHAVNLVENAIGVFGVPLGLGLNFFIDEREHIIPMAIEEASIIAAASRAALIIRSGGGFHTKVDDPIMIGQVQVINVHNHEKAKELLLSRKQEIIDVANLYHPRMVARGGGVKDIEVRIIEDDKDGDSMMVVHLLCDVKEAMGANVVSAACEAAGPLIEEITGGKVNLRILSNLADRRIARAWFNLPYEYLAMKKLSGEQVAKFIVEANRMAKIDPYRAATHNKGIFNGICSAGLALGQDWRAIEAGGHAYAARDGQYRGLTEYTIDGNCLKGRIELPLQVGWVGGAVKSHPGIKPLQKISGIENSRQLAGVLAAVGLGQNFAALHAMCTEGIQKGHMALHARSVALSVGVPADEVEKVVDEMIRRGEVKVAAAEEIYHEMQNIPKNKPENENLPVEAFASGKIVLFGEHATVYGYPGITAAIDVGLKVKISRDPDGPRFLKPHYKQVFPVSSSDLDIRRFSKAVELALATYNLQNEPIAIEVESDLAPGMGLGSSATFSAALCKALSRYKGEEPPPQFDIDLFEKVQKLESIFHGHPSGIDAATVLSKGVLWFRKGPPREILPIRMPQLMTGIVCLVESGGSTIELVERVKIKRRKHTKYIDNILEQIGSLTVDAGIAIGTGDSKELGRLMFRNHELLAKLGVSTPALDEAVELLLDYGVLGAKLTGSGGGGAVISLVEPHTQYDLLDKLSKEFAKVFPFNLGIPA